jgi:hypothetical protein
MTGDQNIEFHINTFDEVMPKVIFDQKYYLRRGEFDEVIDHP